MRYNEGSNHQEEDMGKKIGIGIRKQKQKKETKQI
jgi:hypothetical protein